MLSAQMQQFRQLVFSDAQLRAALCQFSSDEAFAAGAIELASRQGILLSAQEVDQALAAGQREWLERWL